MDGRAFLRVADELSQRATEADWRTAAGRAYYAVFHESWSASLRWGFMLPPRENAHHFVRLRFRYAANADLQALARALEALGYLRNLADYHLSNRGRFATNADVRQAVRNAETAITQLDAVESDPARRTAAIAALRAVWP